MSKIKLSRKEKQLKAKIDKSPLFSSSAKLSQSARSNAHIKKYGEGYNTYYNNLTCPKCKEPRAYVNLSIPRHAYCNRKDKCQWTGLLSELIPETDYEKEYPASKEDPRRPARMYLTKERGLREQVLQEVDYIYKPTVREGIGAVLFKVGEYDDKKPIYNGRLLRNPASKDRSHNQGPISGKIFLHPKVDYGKQCIIVEGIIDALSLIDMGFPAISILSANPNPENYKEQLPKSEEYILLFDADSAGRKARYAWNKWLADEVISKLFDTQPDFKKEEESEQERTE